MDRDRCAAALEDHSHNISLTKVPHLNWDCSVDRLQEVRQSIERKQLIRPEVGWFAPYLENDCTPSICTDFNSQLGEHLQREVLLPYHHLAP